ncbi:MAG: DNA polymerase III subunit delta [Lachnospiraceae bacterium]|nr:DNA polymerase III subunit delta [Lachnospiraceae bacterium]
MSSINEDIKRNEYAKVYLLTGEEAYLRLDARNRLKKALCAPDDTLNVAVYTGKDINVSEVIDFANTLPFMAEKRVLFIEDSDLFDKTNDELAAFVKDMPESTCMIFMQEKVDKRGKLYKAIQNAGRVVNFEHPTDELLEKWIVGKLSKASIRIKRSALTQFLNQVPRDMEAMDNELEKLIAYTVKKGEIEAADVKAICCVHIEDRVFEMIAAIAAKNRREALSKYYDLLTLKEPPLKILSLIARQFNLMLMAKEYAKDGISQDETARRLSVNPYAVKKSLQSARSYTTKELKSIVAECMEYETLIKQGRMDDRMSVEILIASLT